MCGIAGYIGTRPPGEARVAAALAALGHRGPDHAGAERVATPDGGWCVLCHTRLSIIDLDPRADQPFRDGPRLLALNGELYDYREVRTALEAEGERFATASDTEVMARAIGAWGWGALDRMEGMWALALYDEGTGELSLCRDRFGEKPLHLHRDDDGLWFASEPPALFALMGRALGPDREHLRRFLVNGYKSLGTVDRTWFEGVRELPPATLLTARARGAERRRVYWRPSVAQEPDMSREEAVAGARERLIRSVELRLRADVPLAFCLSGGVDSVGLAGIATRALGRRVHGFTVVNTDARYEEADMVAAAVTDLGVDHHEVPLETGAFLPRLRGLVGAHGAPVATITWYAHWRLMERVAAEGYRVSVSGTAADELFSGYYDHHLMYLREVHGDPALHGASRDAWQRWVRPLTRNPHLRDADLFVRDPGFREHVILDADVFSGWLTEPFAEPFSEGAYGDDLLRRRMLNELMHEAVPVILREDDRNAMHWSVENRSPYLDRPLAEHCARIPTRHLVRDGYAKSVLRDALRGLAPDAVLDNRRKVGFNAPIGDLLDRSDPAVRAEVLADSPVWDLVRREAVAELMDAPDLPNSRSKFLFTFLNVKMFLEECGRG